MTMNDYHSLADQTLAAYEDALIEADVKGEVDVELQDGILTITMEDGRQFVLNKHAPTQQLWLSSPISGASHHRYDEPGRKWVSTREGDPLHMLMVNDVSVACGLDLSRMSV